MMVFKKLGQYLFKIIVGTTKYVSVFENTFFFWVAVFEVFFNLFFNVKIGY